MSKYTPTPWVKDHGGTWGHIKSIGDCGACGKNNVKRTPTVARYDMNELVIPLEEQEANARHIVHCVNNYDRMREVLSELCEIAEYGDVACWDERWDKARALLAQLDAKGEE